jgi:hypothetical protein
MTEAVKCKCGAKLDDRGRCPALCEPLRPPLPKYTGPTIIGLTHVGRLAMARCYGRSRHRLGAPNDDVRFTPAEPTSSAGGLTSEKCQ